jgi:hypothetical protein
MNARLPIVGGSLLLLACAALSLVSACSSDTKTNVPSAAGSGGVGGASGASGKAGASGAGTASGGAGAAGSGGSQAGDGAGGEGGASGEAGASSGGASGAAEAGAAGADTGAACNNGGPACASGSACDTGQCVDVAGALSGLRWELPCTAAHSAVNCACPATDTKHTTLAGTAGKSYSVTLHFRGIVEEKTYSGGTAGNATGSSNPTLFISGGTPAADTWNIYSLAVSSPAQTFYLNAGASGTDQTRLIDYQATITMAFGALVTLTANSVENVETFNRDGSGAPVIVTGVPPAPLAYDGQFVQVDVESVVPM